MRYCTNCGAQLAEGARFCTVCGTRIENPVNEAFFELPDAPGEFELQNWTEQPPAPPATPTVAPAPQPTRAQVRQAAPAPSPRPAPVVPKKKPFILRAFLFIVGLVITAVILLVLYWLYQGYTSV